MKKRITITLIICILSWPILAQNVKFHLICNIDRYSNVAESCKKDFDNVKAFFTDVANDLKIPIEVYDVDFYGAESKKFITAFKCSPNDIVFYYYSGHGFRYDDQDVVWPYLHACKKDTDPIDKCSLSLNWVYQEIKKKNPRLTIAIGDCCNSLIGLNEPKMSLSRSLTYRNVHQPNGYKKLFLETKGSIVASGSIPKQYSYGTEEGGMFSNSLIEVLKNSRENPSVTWKAALTKATSITLTNSEKKQKPHFMVSDSQGMFYSEGKYPDDKIIANNTNNKPNNNTSNTNNKPNNNNNNKPNNTNNNKPNNNTNNNTINDDKVYNEKYNQEEMQSEALYAMGLIYIVGLSADDSDISDAEQTAFYDFFSSTMTDWGYEADNVDQFIVELAKWIENMLESELETELSNSLSILKKYYDAKNYKIIVYDNLNIMVDDKTAQGFKDVLTLFKSM